VKLRQQRMVALGAVSALVVLSVTGGVHAYAQKVTPAEVAARLSGTWKLNRELSPLAAPARGRGRGAPAFAVAGGQRGGGRGGGAPDTPASSADLTPEVLAAQGAMRSLQQLAELLTIKAAADAVTFTDLRGEQTFAIDGKSARLTVNGAAVAVKSRWDKQTLRQELSTPQMKLVRAWEVDDDGRLVLKVRVESMTLNSPDARAVYDRQ
jgi:hypothetical protein